MLLSLVGCTQSKKQIFIVPANYSGWVNIVFEEANSKNEAIEFDGGEIYVITGNPEKFSIKSQMFTPGSYETYIYSVSGDSITELSWNGFPYKQVELAGSRNQNGNVKTGLVKNPTFSFYVSAQLKHRDSLYLDKLPENALFPR